MAGYRELNKNEVSPPTSQAMIGVVALLTLIIIMFSTADSQISPGDLHKSHAALEGLTNCEKCHDSKRENMASNCLSCHVALKQQIRKGKGLHARNNFAKCELCHVEHQGRDFDLIFFKGGIKSFDHSSTGYNLAGAHASLECRQCHKPGNIKNADQLKSQSVAIDRTYLGLNQDCLSCHNDEHRDQLSKNCMNCHNMNTWKPAPGFDHNQTNYPLIGEHKGVACVKCHKQIVDKSNKQDPTYLSFAKQQFNQCSNCHTDFHKGNLGPNCNQCHNTSGWGSVKMTNFDHSRTQFPLIGMHANVKCEKCHGDRTTNSLKFSSCKDCHSDSHRGEFANRAKKGACEECHVVQGFIPSTFTMLKHDETLFPLVGAHRAISCVSCHVVDFGKKKRYQFSFESLRCPECHQDPHHGQVDRFSASTGCETCHRTANWETIEFSHMETNFPLEGAHIGLPCQKCHKPEKSADDHNLRFKPLSTKCASCHAGKVTIEDLKG